MPLGMSAEEIYKSGFELYVGLVDPNEGLDASGVMTEAENIKNIFNSTYGRLYIPKIFKKDGVVGDRDKKEAEVEATRKAMSYASSTNNEALVGVKMRKSFAGVEGDVLVAPVPKEMVEKIKDGEPFDSAILLTQMATHEMVGNDFKRLSKEDKEDILTDLRQGKERKQRKSRRKSRKGS